MLFCQISIYQIYTIWQKRGGLNLTAFSHLNCAPLVLLNLWAASAAVQMWSEYTTLALRHIPVAISKTVEFTGWVVGYKLDI